MTNDERNSEPRASFISYARTANKKANATVTAVQKKHTNCTAVINSSGDMKGVMTGGDWGVKVTNACCGMHRNPFQA